MAIFCPKCGTQNSDDAKFCAACGGAMPQVGSPQQQPSPPQTQPTPVQGAQTQPFSPEFFENLGLWGKITAGAGVVGVIATILPWRSASGGGVQGFGAFPYSVNGFYSSEGTLFFLGMLGVVILCFISASYKTINPTLNYILAGCAGFSALMILVVLLRDGFTAVSIGFILALISAGVVVYGTIMKTNIFGKKS